MRSSRLAPAALIALFFVALAAALSGCAEMGAQNPGAAASSVPSAPPPLTAIDVQALYKLGLTLYGENQLDLALSDLDAAAASKFLKPSDEAIARKTMAFIYCATKREAQCREQFQLVLKLDPNFKLSAAEADHPVWGPIWVSVRGAGEDDKAVSRGSESKASKGQQKLAEGIKEYDAGHFKEAAAALQTAVDSGLPDKADQLRAHKFAAFSYCLMARMTQCRAEFHANFLLDAKFELLPSEAGHPAWAGTYRRELAAARKAQATAAVKQAAASSITSPSKQAAQPSKSN
jgi:tetratricopeptide (TPR) repeat protein